MSLSATSLCPCLHPQSAIALHLHLSLQSRQLNTMNHNPVPPVFPPMSPSSAQQHGFQSVPFLIFIFLSFKAIHLEA